MDHKRTDVFGQKTPSYYSSLINELIIHVCKKKRLLCTQVKHVQIFNKPKIEHFQFHYSVTLIAHIYKVFVVIG